ncbi:MAG TPA: aminofutalosine synthase MqnE [Bacteroidia bacterium]|nr:aminofutalosine synthase MqnE [Bacteroidia bacterium]
MQREAHIDEVIASPVLAQGLKAIAEKVKNGERISTDDALFLYEHGDAGFLGTLANYVRQKRHGDITYFNRNFHIEPTNICVYDCKFCSYSRLLKQKEGSWELSMDDMFNIVKSYDGQPVTEVHIVGGVHPKLGLEFFGELLKKIKVHRPELHIKGFTAVELHYMIRKAKMSYREGLQYLKDCGLDSIPGGGAEIFDEEIRRQISEDKCTSAEWLEIHQTAHELGIPSNVTMLYGHIENYAHRVDHMNRVRDLQDKTNGFNTFIPLKFRNKDNQMENVPEISVIEDMRNYAVARIFMDNVAHVKAYWPMIGRDSAQLSLNFGVDDIDGTIDDTTKIYSMAGAEEQTPALTTAQLVDLISGAGRIAAERDTLYNVIQKYSSN